MKKNDMNVKVSIIVPVYNVERYIKKCLDSLVCQTLNNIEIIVVNDGSPDNSELIINEYAQKYSNIRYFKKENGGVGSARNFGLSKAIGKYILFVDSDDYIDITMAEKMYNSAVINNSDMVICNINDLNEKTGNIVRYFNNTVGVTNVYDNKALMLNRPAPWNKLYRKELFDDPEFRYVSNKWYEDLRLTTKLYLKCKTISFVEENLYYYLIRENSIMNNKNISRNYEIIEAFEDIINYFKKNNFYQKFYEELNFLGIEHIYIAAAVRVITNSDSKEAKKNVAPLYDYFNHNFSLNNKYIYLLSKNKRVIYFLLKHRMYSLVKFIFRMKGKI